MSSFFPLFLLGAAVLVGLVVLGAFFSHDARVKRALRKAPLHTTATFPAGAVATVQGTVCQLAEAPLVAPLTGRACAYYEAIVEEYRSSGKSGAWYPIIREQQGQDFLLDDGQGTARVIMHNASVALVKDVHFRSGLFEDATPVLEDFLARHGRASQGWVFNKKLRYREGVIEPGELVAVCGQGTREADPSPHATAAGYRDTPTRLLLSAAPAMPLYVSDDMSALR
jgi:hypothetical protein